MLHQLCVSVVSGSLLFTVSAPGETPAQKLHQQLVSVRLPGLIHSALGTTRRETPIACLLASDHLDLATPKTRILLIGGLDGSAGSVDITLKSLRWFQRASEATVFRREFSISAVPCSNPDGWAAEAGPSNGSDGNPSRGYPPNGPAYRSPTDPEAAYLWRWIGMHAPDLVVDIRPGDTLAWHIPKKKGAQLNRLAAVLHPVHEIPVSDQLVSALVRVAPCATGLVPALQVRCAVNEQFLPTLLQALQRAEFRGPSAARMNCKDG